MAFDLTAVLKNIAPMIAGTLGGPLAGMAVNAILGAVSPDHAQEIADAGGAANPQGALAKIGDLIQQGAIQTAQIKQAELAHAERMAELGYKSVADLAAIDAGDRDSARKREIAVRDATPAVLAYLVTAGFFGILGYILANGVPKQGGDALLILLGSLGTAWTGIVAYYFGSSAGSAKKDSTIAGMASK